MDWNGGLIGVCKRGNKEIARILKQKGANNNMRDVDCNGFCNDGSDI